MYVVLFLLMALGASFQADADAAESSPQAQILVLKQKRTQAKMMADEAGREANRYMSQDWLSYKRALQRQQYLNHRVEELDKQISELQKQAER